MACWCSARMPLRDARRVQTRRRNSEKLSTRSRRTKQNACRSARSQDDPCGKRKGRCVGEQAPFPDLPSVRERVEEGGGGGRAGTRGLGARVGGGGGRGAPSRARPCASPIAAYRLNLF